MIAQGISFLIALRYMRRSPHEHLHLSPRTMRFDREIFRTVLRIGLPSGVQQSLVSLGFVALTRIVNPFGTNVIAGHTAASRLDSFAAMPAMNLSVAVSTLAVAAAISLTMTAVLVFFKRELVGLFAADPEVVAIGAGYLVIVSAFYPVFSSMFVTGGVIRGAGDTLTAMIFTLVALWVVRIPASAFLSTRLGSTGIWWGIPAGWIVGFSANLVYYLRGRWKRKVIARPVAAVPGS